MANLRTDDLWDRITALAKKAKRRFVAVAWLSRGASKLLPLGRDDVLVVDMSDGSVKTGRTDPKEVLAYLKLGVRVYSVSNLHAKVFVLGDHVVIGSSNVSTHSRDTLLEAGIESSDPSLRANARKWIQSLARAPITPALASAKAKLYKPPQWGTPAGLHGKAKTTKSKKKVVATEGRLWIVTTENKEWPSEEAPILAKQVAEAKRKLKDKITFHIDSIRFPGITKFRSQVKRGDFVVTIHDDGDSIDVYSPAPVVSARRYRVGKMPVVGVHLQFRNDAQPYYLRSFKKVCKKIGIKITATTEREVASPVVKDALLQAFAAAR